MAPAFLNSQSLCQVPQAWLLLQQRGVRPGVSSGLCKQTLVYLPRQDAKHAESRLDFTAPQATYLDSQSLLPQISRLSDNLKQNTGLNPPK